VQPRQRRLLRRGTTTVNCSATEGATCNFTVTVNDTQAPVPTCPADITVSESAVGAAAPP